MVSFHAVPDPDPYSVPLAEIDMSVPELYQHNLHWAYFARLRAEDPDRFLLTAKLNLAMLEYQ